VAVLLFYAVLLSTVVLGVFIGIRLRRFCIGGGRARLRLFVGICFFALAAFFFYEFWVNIFGHGKPNDLIPQAAQRIVVALTGMFGAALFGGLAAGIVSSPRLRPE
jgi:hypothetical protein